MVRIIGLYGQCLAQCPAHSRCRINASFSFFLRQDPAFKGKVLRLSDLSFQRTLLRRSLNMQSPALVPRPRTSPTGDRGGPCGQTNSTHPWEGCTHREGAPSRRPHWCGCSLGRLSGGAVVELRPTWKCTEQGCSRSRTGLEVTEQLGMAGVAGDSERPGSGRPYTVAQPSSFSKRSPCRVVTGEVTQ